MSSQISKVIKFETIRQIKKPSFWVAILAGPLLILGLFVLNFFNSSNLSQSIAENAKKHQDTTVGIFNESALFKEDLENPTKISEKPKITAIETQPAGLEALKNKQISAFYHIPADFEQTLTIESYSIPNKSLFSDPDGKTFVKSLLNLVATKDISPAKISIIKGQFNFKHQFIDQQTGDPTNPIGKAIFPIATLVIFYVVICIFGNRMFMTVVEEKETRISEMILTTITAKELIIGKIISSMIIGLIIILCLAIPAISGIILYRDAPFVQSVLGSITIDPVIIFTNLLILVLAYFFITCCATIVGAVTATAREASQYGGIVILGVMIPFFFMNAFTLETPTIITHIITAIPFSNPIALMLRNAAGTISTTELIIYTALLAFYAVSACVVAIKSFEKHALSFSSININLLPKKRWKTTKK